MKKFLLEWIPIIGVLLVFTFIILMITLIWCFSIIIIKCILTVLSIIGVLILLEKGIK